jgi:hypothetical protein
MVQGPVLRAGSKSKKHDKLFNFIVRVRDRAVKILIEQVTSQEVEVLIEQK